jgi:hypothetical protein
MRHEKAERIEMRSRIFVYALPRHRRIAGSYGE